MSNNQIASILNNLIETCKDGQEGFRAAAENLAGDYELKNLFSSYSMQRARFVGELQAEAATFGEYNPEDSTSVVGTIHRGWMNLKSALASNDRHAILAECERGEDVAVSHYEKALATENLPPHLSTLIQRQLQEIRAAHDKVRDLRDAAAPEPGAVAATGPMLARSRARAGDAVRSSTEYVRENPIPVIIGAAVVGIGIGLLLVRRHQEEENKSWFCDASDHVKAAALPLLWPIAKNAMRGYDQASRSVRRGAHTASKSVRHGAERAADTSEDLFDSLMKSWRNLW